MLLMGFKLGISGKVDFFVKDWLYIQYIYVR
jgi:hypothetical protein